MRTVREKERLARYKETILEAFDSALDAGEIPEVFKSVCKAAAERFDKLGFPHKTHELFTYVDTALVSEFDPRLVGKKASLDVASLKIVPDSETSVIVLRDGLLDNDATNLTGTDGAITATPLEEVLVGNKMFTRRFIASFEREKDVFTLLNGAFLRGGVSISIADEITLPSPLHIIIYTDGSTGSYTTPRVVLSVGASSRATVIISYIDKSGDAETFTNAVAYLHAAENSEIDLIETRNDIGNKLFTRLTVTQSGGSSIKHTAFTTGSPLMRDHYDWRLMGEKATVDFKRLAVVRAQNVSHLYARFRHEAPNCTTDIHYKNILDDRGRTSVDSAVKVFPGASGTDSKQLVNNLLLSDAVRADTKPNLMIHNDDVKCAHGATVGQVDEDQLFYLRTRGLSADEAQAALVGGFARDIINKVAVPELVPRLTNSLLGDA